MKKGIEIDTEKKMLIYQDGHDPELRIAKPMV